MWRSLPSWLYIRVILSDHSMCYLLTIILGIAWLAVEINPIIFEIIGLGMGEHGRPIR